MDNNMNQVVLYSTLPYGKLIKIGINKGYIFFLKNSFTFTTEISPFHPYHE